MATWEEQGGPDAKDMEPIAPCAFVFKRGEKPDFAYRSNIFPYNEMLAMNPNRWAPLLDGAGEPIASLPKMKQRKVTGTPVMAARMVKEEPPVVSAPDADDMRRTQVFVAFQQLEAGDYKATGEPRPQVVAKLAGMDDLTSAQVKTYWGEFQKKLKEKSK